GIRGGHVTGVQTCALPIFVSNIHEVKARGGRVIALTSRSEPALAGKLDYEIRIPETIDMFTPILASVPLQLLAYYIAVKRGANRSEERRVGKEWRSQEERR